MALTVESRAGAGGLEVACSEGFNRAERGRGRTAVTGMVSSASRSIRGSSHSRRGVPVRFPGWDI
jgi:hypothetical protein